MKPIEILLTQILNCSRVDLYLKEFSLDNLSENQKKVLREMVDAYLKGMPVQYILGQTEFMGLEFKVREGVFIPRPETEILVEAVINIVKLLNCQTIKLLDVGTGSGCIAVSLAKFLSDATITATDTCEVALEVARENAQINDVGHRIRFIKSDLFTSYELLVTSYNIIISNPPYIPTEKIKDLPIQVRSEPKIALDGGLGGLNFYRRIIKESPNYLRHCGYLILEMGDNQSDDIEEIFKESQEFRIIEKVEDYNSIERAIVAQKI